MEKQFSFPGILSNKPDENPDFYNWNRVKLRYCDGASFAGDGQDEAAQLYFRGQRIWSVAMEALMATGKASASQVLLSGYSAGGLPSIIHCDEFRDLFPESTKVKCLSDVGMFLDAMDVSGGRTLHEMYAGVVSLQLQASLAPPSADPHGYSNDCKQNHAECNSSQIQFLQGQFQDKLGNVVERNTQLPVVKRELPKQLQPGQVFNIEARKQALRNINSLALFSNIEVNPRPDEKNEGGIIVEIKLKEPEPKSAEVSTEWSIVPGRG